MTRKVVCNGIALVTERALQRVGHPRVLSRRTVLRQIGGGGMAAVVGAAGIGTANTLSAPGSAVEPQLGQHQEGITIDFEYGTRKVRISDESGALLISLDGVPVDAPIALHQEQYHSHFFPFTEFPTLESLAQRLVDSEGYAWVFSGRGIDVNAILNS